jgi:hypothetical protein
MTALAVIEGVALLLLTLLVMGLLRSHADILRALDELGVGRPDAKRATNGRAAAAPPVPPEGIAAPAVRGHTIDGESIAVAFGGGEDKTVLAFLSATCHTCAGFWNEFSQPETLPAGMRLIAVVQGVDNLTRVRKLAGDELMVVISDDAWLEYDVPGSPHFVLVDGTTGGIVGEGTGSTWAQVHALLEHAEAPDPTSVVAFGDSPRDNALRIDRELADAGIGPGHPSLYVGEDTIPAKNAVA